MLSELNKMVKGELYNSLDTQLVLLRQRASDILSTLNSLPPSREEEKILLLSTLFKRDVYDIKINTPFSCDYGINIKVGKECIFDYGCIMNDGGVIQIGDRCNIGPGVFITTAKKVSPKVERLEGLETTMPVVIGDDVWIGAGSVIHAGVIIGNGTAISPESVVTRNIPANCIAGGNPCQVITWLEEDDDIIL
ncbi:MAG: sugar O-acetyltransferase [Oscillospiraceae bacterium]